MNKTIYLPNIPARLLGALLLAATLLGAPRMAARTTYQINDTARIGLNAVDYVLQRPLGSPTFSNKHFLDHLFVTGGLGAGTVASDSRTGAMIELSLGDWATPVHGWRLSANAGVLPVRKGYSYPSYGGLSLDYLMNLSTLLRGENPNRKVELIGALGVEWQHVRYRGLWGNEWGVRGSLQARFNAGRTCFFYIEPRLGLMAGTRYTGVVDNFRRFRPYAGITVGMGYRLLTGTTRNTGNETFFNVDDNHLFFGVGGGATSLIRGVNSNTISPIGKAYMGKMFSASAGLRVKVEASRLDFSQRADDHRYMANGALDFVWDLASTFGGYRPNDPFGLKINLGVAAAYVHGGDAKLHFGPEASLTASVRLSRNWSIFVEPQVQLYSRSFNSDALGRVHHYNPIGSITAGLHYTFGNYSHDFANDYTAFAASRKRFVSFMGGPTFRLRGDRKAGPHFAVSYGQRFTPISSWRISGFGEYFNTTPRFATLGVSADYMFSISTAMAGFNPDRVFDLSGLLGIGGGIAGNSIAVRPMYEGKVGLHGAFRLTEAFDIFLEPQLVALHTATINSLGWNAGPRLNIGVTYRLP